MHNITSIPVGAITLTLPDAIPPGSLLCDGRALNRTQYSHLYMVLGDRCGGSIDDNTFHLPGPFNAEALHGMVAVIKY